MREVYDLPFVEPVAGASPRAVNRCLARREGPPAATDYESPASRSVMAAASPPLSVCPVPRCCTSTNGDANAVPAWKLPSCGLTVTRYVPGLPLHRTPLIPAVPDTA